MHDRDDAQLYHTVGTHVVTAVALKMLNVSKNISV